MQCDDTIFEHGKDCQLVPCQWPRKLINQLWMERIFCQEQEEKGTIKIKLNLLTKPNLKLIFFSTFGRIRIPAHIHLPFNVTMFSQEFVQFFQTFRCFYVSECHFRFWKKRRYFFVEIKNSRLNTFKDEYKEHTCVCEHCQQSKESVIDYQLPL